jgi:ribosomal protein S18 acetylase RimI-like enzyme
MSVAGTVITLRQPGVDDCPQARALVAATGAFRSEEIEIAAEVFTDAVAAPGEDYWALGAFEGNDLMGFVCYGPTPGTVATWDLYWIAVHPAMQRQGVGRLLLATCEEAVAAQGGKLIVIETSSRDDYAATRAFYETRGYCPAARIADYYAPHDDLIVYTKSLAPHTEETADHG